MMNNNWATARLNEHHQRNHHARGQENCPECQQVITPVDGACPLCGYLFPQKKARLLRVMADYSLVFSMALGITLLGVVTFLYILLR